MVSVKGMRRALAVAMFLAGSSGALAADDGVWSVSKSSGDVWIATMESGICRVSPDGAFRRWTTENGLASDSTRFVFEDAESDLYVIRDGIVVIPNGTVVPDGTVI